MKFAIITPSHYPRYLEDAWNSIKAQELLNGSHVEWIILANGPKTDQVVAEVRRLQQITHSEHRLGADVTLTISIHASKRTGGIGAIKHEAFMLNYDDRTPGDILVELDHDDMLAPGALVAIETVAKANPNAGFFYSDTADMPRPDPDKPMRWMPCGWQFYQHTDFGMIARQFKPSAAAMATILFAPNHLRAWRHDVYWKLGGHDPRLNVCDDHDLLVRTYLETEMVHIPQPLYRQRVHYGNTWPTRQAEIDTKTREIGNANLENLILREAKLRKLPVFDLGAASSPREGWKTVDLQGSVDVRVDLRQPWPWPDNSVFAFRAQDFLEHLPDKMHTMSEIHRCLVPGGWLLSSTPSTDGRGAFQDPTHVSYWNSNSFWYWTRPDQMRYINNKDVLFSTAKLENGFPSDWHKLHEIPYVTAHLIALKPGYEGPREPTPTS